MNYCNCPNCRTENCPNAGTPGDRIADLEATLELVKAGLESEIAAREQASMGLPKEPACLWRGTSYQVATAILDHIDELLDYAVAMTVENDDYRAAIVKANSDLFDMRTAYALRNEAIERCKKAEATLAAERKISANLVNQMYDARATRDDAKSALATARQDERERIAVVFDAMQHTGNMAMAAAIVRALTDEEPK